MLNWLSRAARNIEQWAVPFCLKLYQNYLRRADEGVICPCFMIGEERGWRGERLSVGSCNARVISKNNIRTCAAVIRYSKTPHVHSLLCRSKRKLTCLCRVYFDCTLLHWQVRVITFLLVKTALTQCYHYIVQQHSKGTSARLCVINQNKLINKDKQQSSSSKFNGHWFHTKKPCFYHLTINQYSMVVSIF